MSRSPGLYLGNSSGLDASNSSRLCMPPHHLVTHGVVVGMTGSGKTGLVTVFIEEALRANVPTLVIDVKGDLANLLLAFPSFSPLALEPWAAASASAADERSIAEIAAALAAERAQGLSAWGIDETQLARYRSGVQLRVLTPGSNAGESLHVLSALERRSTRWDTDVEAARAALSAAVSLLLSLVGRESDPAKSREHVLLSVLAERRLRAGQSAELGALLGDLTTPPLEQIGALPLNDFVSKSDRRSLCAALNTLLGSPTLQSWREGVTLDVGEWLTPGLQTPAVVVSVAHLEDEERALVLGVLLEEVRAWMRGLSGSRRLRALVVFDEVYGFLPPHPANPATKGPLVSLLKQGRAFGVGVLLATQNPMDLDYRALSNAGLWCVGRLQTDADRERVVDGLRSADSEHSLDPILKHLAPRWFVMRDTHATTGPVLLQPRWAMSYLHGPMTRTELGRARKEW